MNKKLIYLSVFLILGVFLVSACNETKGIKITDGKIINQQVTYKGVLNMLNKNCHVTSITSLNDTCNRACTSINEVCIGSSFSEEGYIGDQKTVFYNGDLISCDYKIYPPSFGGEKRYDCTCCSLSSLPS